MDRLHASARAITEGIEPRLTLAVDVLFPVPKLLDAIRELAARHPLVSLHLRTEALGAVTQLVLDGTAQIGIGIGIVTGRELEQRALMTVELVPVAAPGHALARSGAPLGEDDLRDAVQIVVSDRSALTEGRDHGVYSERTWRVADLDAKREMILAGFGWGQMPLHRVEHDLEAGRLLRLTLAEVDPASFRVALSAIHRVADPPGPAGRWLLERLAR
jgi:DNA-binding transcriptional LysR family regulator